MARQNTQTKTSPKDTKDNTKKDIKDNTNSQKDFWDLKPLLASRKEEDILASIEKNVKLIEAERKNLKDDIKPSDIKRILEIKDQIFMDSAAINSYYDLKFYENTSDQDALSKMSHLKQVFTELDNRIMFFSLWFMKLDEKNARRIIDAKELAAYKHYFERIRSAKDYTLTEEIEQIINIKGMTSGGALAEIYEVMTNGFTYEFNGKTLTREEVTAFYRSQDPKLREAAYKATLSKFKDNSLVLSEMYKNIVLDWYNEDVKIRKYKEPISSRNLGNDVDDKAVDALMKVVQKNAKVFTEYFRLKYSLNQKQGKYPYSRFHLYAPFASRLEKKYPYAQSKKYSLETYRMFDERLYEAAKLIFDKRCVHSHPQKDKRSGAFCMNITNKLPPYVMLNHTDELNDLFTMMHELGHGIHDVFSQKQVNALQHAGLPMAETASVFGEMLLSSRILSESKDDEEKKAILVHMLDNQYATIVRQTYFVIFEKFAHDKIKGTITKEELDKKYYALLKEQFGDMEIPELFMHEWNYIPHIHETPFYCYAYSWGNLLVLALYDMYRKEGKPFVEKYIRLLSTGGSRSAAEMLIEIGIDPSKEEFWQRGFNIIKEEIEQLKRLK